MFKNQIRLTKKWTSDTGWDIFAWFKDEIFRRLFINASWLLGTKLGSGILELVTVAITARVLGPSGYGMLALVLVYADTIGKTVSFQAWQAIVKFGSDSLYSNDTENLKRVIKFGFSLDIFSALLGLLIAIFGAKQFIILLNWDFSIYPLLVLYSWLILFSLTGTPTGVLRLFNRFDLLSYSNIFHVALKFVGVIWAITTQQELIGFIWVFLITGIISQIFLVLASFWVLHKNKLGNFVFTSLKGIRRRHTGIWSFVLSTNLNSTLRLASTNLDVVLMGSIAGVEAVGIYRLAKTSGSLFGILFDPLTQAIFPEMTMLWAKQRRDQLLQLIKRTTFFVGVGSSILLVIFILLGGWIIYLGLGPQFHNSPLYITSLLYLIGVSVGMVGCTLHPLALAMNKPTQVLILSIFITLFYLIILFPAINIAGAPGAAFSYILFMIPSILGRYYIVDREWKYKPEPV